MNKEEYLTLTRAERPAVVSVDLLQNATPRTLMYGYTCARDTFHVYLSEPDADGVQHIVRVVYDNDNISLVEPFMDDQLTLDVCVPDKRAYPEACDLEFCEVLAKHRINIPFTNFNPDRDEALWHGLKVDELLPRDLLKQLAVDEQVEPEDLSLVKFHSLPKQELRALVDDCSRAFSAQVAGYLRARVVRGETKEHSMRWLENIPMAVMYFTEKHPGDIEFSEVAKAALVAKGKFIAEARLKKILPAG